MLAKKLAISLAFLALCAAPALAWGELGHKAIVRLAAERLTVATQAQVADLLESPDALTGMDKYAAWADEIRKSRSTTTAHWHYVDIPITSDGYDAARDCAGDDCVVGQINREIAIIKDKLLAKPVRAEALQFLIHFVGDLHQPLHCANNDDHGGNDVKVMAGPQKTSLHAVWDTAVVNAVGTKPEAIAAVLSPRITPQLAAAWATGTPEQWVNEGFLIAKQKIYPAFPGAGPTKDPIFLPNDYPASVGPITAVQLAKAGIRLAAVLNAALDTTRLEAPSSAAAATPNAPQP